MLKNLNWTKLNRGHISEHTEKKLNTGPKLYPVFMYLSQICYEIEVKKGNPGTLFLWPLVKNHCATVEFRTKLNANWTESSCYSTELQKTKPRKNLDRMALILTLTLP